MSADERPLTAAQLRLIASWAGGDRTDQDVVFERTPRGLRRRPRGDGAGTPVLVARSRATVPDRTPVRSLSIAVGDDRLELQGRADAVFWSEASVTKFLLPFLSTLAGEGARAVVRDASAAWQNYPHARIPVEVYAMTHAPDPDDVDARQAVQVVHRMTRGSGSPLQAMDLDAFLNAYDVPREHREVRQEPPIPPIETRAVRALNAASLRQLAEWAAGVPDRLLRFAHGAEGWRLLEDGEAPGADEFVVPAFTPSPVPERPRPDRVTLRTATGRTLELADRADAVFWADGSVEQFLLPYYAWKGGSRAARTIGTLQRVWIGGPTRAADPDDGDDAAPEDVDVVALAHLPKSEYVTEPEGPGLVFLGVVYADDDGDLSLGRPEREDEDGIVLIPLDEAEG